MSLRVSAITLLLLCTLLIPEDISIYLGGLRLTPYRLILIALLPLVLMRLLRWRPALPDTLVVIYALWIPASVIANQGLKNGLESGGVMAMETLVPYFCARTLMLRPHHFKRAFSWIVVVAAALWVLALPEAVLGHLFIRETLGAIFGNPESLPYEQRLGFTRALTTFDHPILYGMFCSSAIGLTWYLYAPTPNKRLFLMGSVAFSAMLSLSSAPYLAIVVQLLLIFWRQLSMGMTRKFTGLIVGGGAVFGAVWGMIGKNPLLYIIQGFTIEPQTGMNRLWQWEIGLDNMAARPLLGVGLLPHDKPQYFTDSIDSLWLYVGIEFGVIALAVLLLAFILVIADLERLDRLQLPPEHQQLVRGLVVTLLATGVVATTVHFWHNIYVYWFFLLGCGVQMVRLPEMASARARQQRYAQAPRMEPRLTAPWSASTAEGTAAPSHANRK
ncbi:O-Antigen ligase [Limimonas halophila]|uniref:O-Antigen ligase n=1 Tax=Limimonas halophila TaxID=1082479 RepID=A0A1G7NNC1_9PROT|nr:O-antigen ligase family protein [Limimonas halophila]SDF74779.1 O-Antigen ligase [Limimonas halophila]